MRRGTGLLVAGALLAGCSGDDGDATEATTTVAPPDESGEQPAGTVPESPADSVPETDLPDDASIEDVLAAAPVPDLVDASSERPCERWGYACDPLAVTAETQEETAAAIDAVATAMGASDDAREQLRLGLVALSRIDGVGHVEADVETATMVAFTVNGGPRAAVITVAGELQEGGELAPVDESFVPPPGTPDAEPQGFAGTGFRSGIGAEPRRDAPTRSAPRRYEPAGGPLATRRAAVYNPFAWGSGDEVAAIFRANDEYGTVDVYGESNVDPFTVERAGSYDAVYIVTHGGGSCPSWTDDPNECSAAFVGGLIDYDAAREQLQASDRSVGVDFFECTFGSENRLRWCFNSNAFPSNPNGIVVFNSCGSALGFNRTGAGASIGWTGTSQRRVVERTAVKLWELLVTEGVEFELAKEIVQGSGLDSHLLTFWASFGDVSPRTRAAFEGRNLRARDVVEMRLDGAEPQGQVLQFTGRPSDGQAETFPARGQQVTFTVEGVRDGTAQGVTVEIRGDGVEWKSDINLGRDGTAIDDEDKDGYATWQVTLDPDSVEIPDVAWTDLSPSRAPVELEIRAFERSSEYTAYQGTVRLGTDVEFTGPLPIFEQLEDGLPANGELRGNDLRVTINTGTGELTGSMLVELFASGIRVGEWRLELSGTYGPATSVVEGEVVGTSEGGVFDIRASDAGSGTFQGQANLEAQTIQIVLGIGGASQIYDGVVVP